MPKTTRLQIEIWIQNYDKKQILQKYYTYITFE